MGIVRVNKINGFTTVSNTYLRNKEMSLSAKGLLTLVMSLPPDWDYSINGLVAICSEGRRSVRTSMSELEKHGYLKITKISPKKGANTFKYEYDFYEEPLNINVSEPKQSVNIQSVDIRNVHLQNDIQLSTKELNTNKLNKENKDLYVTTKVATKKFENDSVEFLSSKYLADKILKINPNAKVPKDNKELQKWAKHVDYILRIDKRPLHEFREVLKFATTDDFWSSNILSTAKLREKYDQLYFKMTENERITNQKSYSQPKNNKFANFEQRKYDFEEIEKILLEK